MPWKECGAMDERMQFIVDWKRMNFRSFSELCDQYGVTRPTGYKWVERFKAEGLAGLTDLSRRPHHNPNATSQVVVDELVALRVKHPTWGGKKLVKCCSPKIAEDDVPHPTTVDHILRRKGLTRAPKKRRKPSHPGRPTTQPEQPNDLWTADFKGQFRMGNRQYCYPLTIADLYSRYLLACQGLPSTELSGVRPVFAQLFREYGMPRAIRTDNGTPFASSGLARLSQLSAWWIKLGIHPELIEPGCPAQNGAHERMHKTLKREATKPPRSRMATQQDRFDEFRQEYNFLRPHESLGQEIPCSLYEFTGRPYVENPGGPEYPGHFEVRRVSHSHSIRWKNRAINVGSVLIEEYVGLEEVEDGLWAMYFYDYLLAQLDERAGQIKEMPMGLQRPWVARFQPRGTQKNQSYKKPQKKKAA